MVLMVAPVGLNRNENPLEGMCYVYEWRGEGAEPETAVEIVKYEETLEDVLYPALLQLLTIAATTDDNTVAFAALNVAYNLLNEASADLTSTPPPAPHQVLTLTDGDGISTRYELDPKTNLWHDSSGVAYEIETDKVAEWQKEQNELYVERTQRYQLEEQQRADNAKWFAEGVERDRQRSEQEAAQNRFVKEKLTYLEKCVNDRVKGKPEDSYLRGMQGRIEAALNAPGIGENLDPAKFMQLRDTYGKYLRGEVGDESDMLWREEQRLKTIARLENVGGLGDFAGSVIGTTPTGKQDKDIVKTGVGMAKGIIGAIPLLSLYNKATGVTDKDITSAMVDLFDPQIGRQTMRNTAYEIARGESGKAIGLRVVTAIGTGGASEWVFAPAKAYVGMEDYVNRGGDSRVEGGLRAAGGVLVEELLGRAIGKAVGAVGKHCQETYQASKAAYQAGKAGKEVNLSLFSNKATQGQLSDLNKAAGKEVVDIALIGGGGSNVLGGAGGAVGGAALNQLDDAARTAKQKAAQEADVEIKAFKEAQKKTPSKGADSVRNLDFERGQEIGTAKVVALRDAFDNLANNPTSAAAQRQVDHALIAVQQDKQAQYFLNRCIGPRSHTLRGEVNSRKYQFEQAAANNLQTRVAQEYNVPVDKAQVCNASNGMDASAMPSGAAKFAEKPGYTKLSDPKNVPGEVTPSDISVADRRFNTCKTGHDNDVTARLYQTDKTTGKEVLCDVPKEITERIHNEEIYKAYHGGNLPTTRINGRVVTDDTAIKRFAKDMDQTAVDFRSTEAYGGSYSDSKSVLSKGGERITVSDISTVTKTMETKSTEWFHKADDLREAARQHPDSVQRELLRIAAEAHYSEGVRQITKQECTLVGRQVAAINRAKGAGTVKIPEKLEAAIAVLDRVGRDISPEAADQILKNMGTSKEAVAQQSSALMEAMDKFVK